MIERIFTNPGKKLKTVYKVVFGICGGIAMACWVLALVLTAAMAIEQEEIGPFIAALIGVPIVEFIWLFFVWLGMLALVTFADMAIDIKEIKNKLNSVGTVPAAAVEEPTEWACPKCGKINAVANNFCNQCGQPK